MSDAVKYRRWKQQQAKRREQIRYLAITESLTSIAKRFKISVARVSQIVNPK